MTRDGRQWAPMTAGTTATVPVEVVAWVTKFVGGNGSQRRVFEEPVGPDATVRSVLRGLSARFPELHQALWTDGEIGPHVEVLVNDAVLAVADELREEEVMACVVPMPGAVADRALATALVEWCLARLAYFKAPAWILFVTTLPTTGTQKVQKTQIFTRGLDPRTSPGVFDLRALKKRT